MANDRNSGNSTPAGSSGGSRGSTPPRFGITQRFDQVDREVSSVRDGIASVSGRVTSLSDKLKAVTDTSRQHEARLADHQAGMRRLSTDVRTIDAVLDALVKSFGDRLDLVERALQALQSGNSPTLARKSFLSVVREADMSDEDIKKTLLIFDDEELNLTDERFVAELFTAFHAYKEAMNRHFEQQDTRINDLTTEVNHIAAAPMLTVDPDSVKATTKGTVAVRVTNRARQLAAGAVAGVAVALIYWLIVANTVHNHHSQSRQPYVIILVGLIAFFLVAGLMERYETKMDATTVLDWGQRRSLRPVHSDPTTSPANGTPASVSSQEPVTEGPVPTRQETVITN